LDGSYFLAVRLSAVVLRLLRREIDWFWRIYAVAVGADMLTPIYRHRKILSAADFYQDELGIKYYVSSPRTINYPHAKKALARFVVNMRFASLSQTREER